MLRITALLCMLFGFTANTFGMQDRDLQAVIEDAVSAIGNAGNLKKLKSISVTADCEGPKGKYQTTIISFADEMTVFDQTFTYKPEKNTVRINGDIVWTLENGEPVISTPFQRMVARGHEYQKMAFDFQRFFTDLEIVGDVDLEGRPSIKVRGKNELGMSVFVYFDKHTKRFAGYDLEIPGSAARVRNVILEWKKVGELTLPSVVKATDDQGEWILRFNAIKLDIGDTAILSIPPRIADIAELTRLHEQQKTAHLNYNAELFVKMFADNLTQLQRGNVRTQSKSENLKRFKEYFSSYKFIEWEDIVPPVFEISNDGTLATKVVQKRVRGTYTNEIGMAESDDTIFAWLEVWKKIDGEWRVITVASTEKNGPK